MGPWAAWAGGGNQPAAGGGLGGLQGPFHPQPFCDSVLCFATAVKLGREVMPFLLFMITYDRIDLLHLSAFDELKDFDFLLWDGY